MDKYEINVWKDAELLSKEVVEFASNQECYDYVAEKYEAPGTWTGSHQNKNGVTLNRPPAGIRITWAKSGGQHYKPKRLTAEESRLKDKLMRDTFKHYYDTKKTSPIHTVHLYPFRGYPKKN